jgi:prophage antirepressor-like protein
MKNELIPFEFENQAVRMTMIDGQAWWIGKDVCDALELANSRDAISRLDGYEKLMSEIPTSGQIRHMWLVNESGVYSLAFTSNKSKAKEFKKWVTTIVLPEIRKTGGFVSEQTRLDIKDLQARVLELELNRSLTEKMLIRAERTVRRYEEQRLMTYADKKEVLNLLLNDYRISDIQRITKKGRTAIKRFRDEFLGLDDDAMYAELEKIKRGGAGFGLLEGFFTAAARGKGGAV